MWAFEHVAGHYLTFAASDYLLRKQVANVKSALSCGQLCLDEQSFVCRAAVYNETSTECMLANINRHILDSTHAERAESSGLTKGPGVTFAPTTPFSDHVHYLENKCIEGISYYTNY